MRAPFIAQFEGLVINFNLWCHHFHFFFSFFHQFDKSFDLSVEKKTNSNLWLPFKKVDKSEYPFFFGGDGLALNRVTSLRAQYVCAKISIKKSILDKAPPYLMAFPSFALSFPIGFGYIDRNAANHVFASIHFFSLQSFFFFCMQ